MAMDELEALRWHWGSAYIIQCCGPDAWLAQRRDTRKTLRADSAEQLRDKIVADHTANPVSRDLPGQ
jgi:hypothetical protein